MKTKPPQILLALTVLLANGCATALVRSEKDCEEFAVYPATAFDGMWFKEVVIAGDPPFLMKKDTKLSLPRRFLYGIGGIIDLPVSLTTDTLMLPVDILSARKPKPIHDE